MVPLEFIEDYLVDNEEGMRNLITWFLNLVMQGEALHKVQADPYERTVTRLAPRNGHKDRSLKTRFGELHLRKPQFREFPFETQIFGKYARVEKALINAVAESYLQGVSTRKVQDIVSHLGLDQISPLSVSRIAKELDVVWKSFSRDQSNVKFAISSSMQRTSRCVMV
ncbi:MAG: Transposase, Mutator family [Candidatus Syntrophoarchaeum sp. GoM_oil]|nr:MAG: Transposase, Mutator family [Candidatus Syntrophoarchaeum sp. GoM_oil]